MAVLILFGCYRQKRSKISLGRPARLDGGDGAPGCGLHLHITVLFPVIVTVYHCVTVCHCVTMQVCNSLIVPHIIITCGKCKQ